MKATTEIIEEIRERIPEKTDWKALVAQVDALPSLPGSAIQALQLIDDPMTPAQHLTIAIERDPALSARILRLANSAIFARSSPISTIPQAMNLIGFRTLRGIIIAASLSQLSDKSAKIWQLLWRHSVCVALVSRHIAREMKRADADELFVCGLLHNIGQLALSNAAPEQFAQVLDEIEVAEIPYTEAEVSQLDVSHTILGALIIRKWNLPTHFARVVMTYRDPIEEPVLDYSKLGTKVEAHAHIVQLADTVCHHIGIGSPKGYPLSETELLRLISTLGYCDKNNIAKSTEKLKETAKSLFDQEFALYH